MKRKSEAPTKVYDEGRPSKRLASEEDARTNFREGLFKQQTLEEYTQQYADSEPYKYGVIKDLIDPNLLRNVRDEIHGNISFTPKETDIYKIHQSGDLANLDGLDDSSLKLLPSLVALRNTLYSAAFRQYLSAVTNSGPLSGSKTDMAVNVYTPGCHLLCHDDVIGSRRVSYILYLTDPERPWRPEWGGALRLYPTEKIQEEDGSEMKVPSAEFSKVIPPAFNQLSFFAVQPGESFHDVEEVYLRKANETQNDGGRVRMAISGWYHIPQPGEEGFEEGTQEEQAEKSSLAQLQGKADKYDLPQPRWKGHEEEEPVDGQEDDVDLDEDDLNFLVKYMNPRYLTPDTVEELAQAFSDDCSLRLALFLSTKYQATLRTSIFNIDQEYQPLANWNIARPPHKHRFLYRQAGSHTAPSVSIDNTTLLNELIDDFFPSLSFKKWLCLATGLSLTDCNVVARRFRRGLDYTLAQGYDEPEPQLEICLGITPTTGWGEAALDAEMATVENGTDGTSDMNGESSSAAATAKAQEITVGGYEMYMADDEEDDGDDAGSDQGVRIPSSHTGAGKRPEKADPAIYKAAGGVTGDEDEGILFSMPACWNTLSIVLRDQGVLKFVKYVSQSAKGDRWDIVGEWKVRKDSDEDGYGAELVGDE